MEDTTRNDPKVVWNYLATASPLIKLTTGAVIGGIVQHDYVTVHSAPARVVQEIIQKFRHVDLAEGVGLRIPLRPASDKS